MATSVMRAEETVGTDLLNKYALPKVAMVTIAIAAAVGCVMAAHVTGGLPFVAAGLRWLVFLALAVSAGGLLWQWQVVEPAIRLVDRGEATLYAERQVNRFHAIESWALAVGGLGAAGLLPYYWAVGEQGLVELTALVVALWIGSGFWRQTRRSLSPLASLSLAAVALVVVAALEVVHDSPGVHWLLLWRWLHLAALSAWFGGAVWNVFVAVPAARDELSLPVIIAANAQLERFRRIVRVALPLVILTGLLQLHSFFDWQVALLWNTDLGRLALVKLGLVALLIGIFFTCPMWHACSPIAGMCDLDDLPEAERRS